MLRMLSAWLRETPISTFLREHAGFIPAAQTLHILAVAIFLAAIARLDLRLIGWAGRGQTLSDMSRRFMPWVWVALAVLAGSGALLVVAEPDRTLVNIAFQLKMLLLALSLLLTILFQQSLKSDAGYWEASPARRVGAKLLGGTSLLLVVCIVTAGRWISYLIGFR